MTAPDQQPRLRVAYVVVTPVLMWDDGMDLAPGPEAQPIRAALRDLPDLADRIAAEADAATADAQPE